ncbi:iron ABC transporter permease [Sulfurovum sp.]|uniref:FecCD family ABC transporter permease n=1 Tax=Sulfurovum sp. TaxID=1969726 RepID=UPI002A35D5AD|nr:iron ABC transporter permease [Sulfurovum sp.]MDY0402931.1 iron ABC transporter permease [Sulfurovum sp.]
MINKVLWLLLIAVALYSPFTGSAALHLNDLLTADALSQRIFFELRLPRVIFAFLAGMILSLGGLLFQTLFRNPLMTPYTLGISSGAVFGAGIAIILGMGSLAFGIAAITLFGFAGAMLTVLLLIWLSRYVKEAQGTSLLLLGIALSLFYAASLMMLFYLGDAVQNDMLIRFTMGSLSVIGYQMPLLLLIAAALLLGMLWRYRYELQLIAISEDHARLKGVNTKGLTLLLLGVASFSVGVLVSLSGPIGFIGLIVPHIVVKLYPIVLHRRILPTALFGGLFLVVCDTIARTLNTQSELPIGIVTAFIGGPFFIYLIIKRSHR